MICAQCGQEHAIDAMELSFRRPDVVAGIAAQERELTVQEGGGWCVLDDERFFLAAILPLPVAARERPYNIGLWVEVDKSAFERVYQLWSAPEQANERPFPARIANTIASLPDTLDLRGEIQLTGPVTKPRLMLLASDHPLCFEQAHGITAHRAHAYSALAA